MIPMDRQAVIVLKFAEANADELRRMGTTAAKMVKAFVERRKHQPDYRAQDLIGRPAVEKFAEGDSDNDADTDAGMNTDTSQVDRDSLVAAIRACMPGLSDEWYAGLTTDQLAELVDCLPSCPGGGDNSGMSQYSEVCRAAGRFVHRFSDAFQPGEGTKFILRVAGLARRNPRAAANCLPPAFRPSVN